MGDLSAIFANLLVAVVATAFFRQLLWLVPHPWLPWAIASMAGTFVALGYRKCSRASRLETPIPISTFLFIALPVTALFLAHVALPDVTFDVWDYRLFLAERGMSGAPNRTGDLFFRTHNPLPDMVFGIFRWALGFRLGVLPNLLVTIWAGLILEKLSRRLVPSAIFRGIFIAGALLSEGVLFELSTYYVDILPIPFLLEAAYLALVPASDRKRDYVLIAFLCGVACALKLSSGLFVPGIALLTFAKPRAVFSIPIFFRSAAAFGTPLLSHVAFILWGKVNPDAFLARAIEYPLRYVGRSGGSLVPTRGIWEMFSWPLLSFLYPFKASHLAFSTGRLAAAFVASLVLLSLPKTRRLALATLLGIWCWSFVSGYFRFGIFLELVAPLIMLVLVAQLPSGRAVGVGFVAVILSLQVGGAVVFLDGLNWTDRPAAWRAPARHLREASEILGDRHFVDRLPGSFRDATASLDLWIESANKSTALFLLIKNKPIVTLLNHVVSSTNLVEVFPEISTMNIFSLVPEDKLFAATALLTARGFGVAEFQRFRVPVFSEESMSSLVLLRLSVIDNAGPLENSISTTPSTKPFAVEQLRARLVLSSPPECLLPSQPADFLVELKNESRFAWPGGVDENAKPTLRLEIVSRWRKQTTDYPYLAGRAGLLIDLPAGSQDEIPLTVTAPAEEGRYRLRIDLTQEGNATFPREKDSATEIEVTVTKDCTWREESPEDEEGDDETTPTQSWRAASKRHRIRRG